MGQNAGLVRVSGRATPTENHSLKICVLALQVLVSLFQSFPLRLHVEDLPPGGFCNAVNDGGMEVGTTFPGFAVSAQNGILCAQL